MSALETAIRMLARREHSAYELRQKLTQRDFGADEIDVVLARLADRNLQSDERFAEAYIHQRKQKGYGPLRIANELKQKGVDAPVYNPLLYAEEHDWYAVLERQLRKKFGDTPCEDYADKARRIRFLQYRGFALEAINEVL